MRAHHLSSSCGLGSRQQTRWPLPWRPKQCSRRATNSRHTACSALQDLPVVPFTPEQQQQQQVPPADVGLHIPPLAEWGADPFLMSCCEADSPRPLRVAVLVSGGVDSSLALQLVAAVGHKPTAFYLQIWFQEDFRNFWDSCPWEEDLAYARAVCDALGVTLVTVPLTQQYWDRLVSHSVAEIKEGRTPNPDMLCNSRVKFGAFMEHLQQHYSGSFDRIASGHYARVRRQQQQQTTPQPPLPGTAAGRSCDGSSGDSSSSDRSSGGSDDVLLACCPDEVKDQTYFLASLSPEQLSRCMFPLGAFTKPQVRALAAAAGLATSARKDSQGICFLGKVKFGEFVREHLGVWPGPLVEEDGGTVLGLHDGYWFYTVGQRGGIKLPGGPWYVTSKDMTNNIVYVSRNYYEEGKRRDAFVCGPFNWLVAGVAAAAAAAAGGGVGRAAHTAAAAAGRFDPSKPLLVKVRHGPHMYECRLQLGCRQEMLARLQPQQHQQQQLEGHIQQQQQGEGEGDYGCVVLSENDQGLAAGQYAVFYQDGVCLGSAQMLGCLSTSS